MPQYKLNYFNARGRAELIRLIFAQAGQEFVDNRFEGREEWLKEKTDVRRYPFGMAPTLEMDSTALPEGVPVARYLANEFGLSGKTNLEKYWCDVVVNVIGDIRQDCLPFTSFGRKETDDKKWEEQKKEAFEGSIAKKLGHIEGILKANNEGNGFIVGNGVTWADLAIFDMAFTMITMYAACLDKSPKLKALYDRVLALPNIKKHVDTRPVTTI